ncbi:MAG: hypothetical protein HY075_15770 [Deltaproteobacteria bacterium]|nr:hypothetical protein [Deltaproteobacteria bacterium]
MSKIVFLSAHAGIWRHAFPEALVAEALRQAGHEVKYVTCDRVFSDYCVVMAAYGLPTNANAEQREGACRSCRANREVLVEEFKLDALELGDELTAADRAEVDRLMAGLTRESFLELKIDGIDIGRLALYEPLLHFKKSSLSFTDDEWRHYRDIVKTTLLSFFANRRILDREKPECLVVYNSLYAVNSVCVALANQRGITPYFLHGGINLRHMYETLMMGKGVTLRVMRKLRDHWREDHVVPSDARELAIVTDHFEELLKGRNVFAYSSPKSGERLSVRKYFGLKPGQKLLVATLSSYDERFAAETVGYQPPKVEQPYFPTQIEWVQALVEECAKNPDWFLVIRVHPREFPNKRDKVKSEHAQKLEQIFLRLPENARLNWPQDNLSIYDLAEEADVFLNSWSSVGKEMTLLGLPVVLYSSEITHYPPELNYVGKTRDDYFAQIRRALADGWSFERVRMGYRWYSREFTRLAFDISDSYRPNFTPSRALWARVFRKVRSKLSPLHVQRSDCRHRAPRLREQERVARLIAARADMLMDCEPITAKVSVDDETRWLRAELKRLYAAMYQASPTEPVVGEDASLRWRLRAACSGG